MFLFETLYVCQNSLTRKGKWMPVIAIVDDNEPFRHATVSFIRSLGYAVLQFASAEAFLKSNQLDDTDCLISDVQMPGMNGIE
jgi:FixJ family two-component response regulator